QCTDFEHDLEETMTRLKERGIYSVEFITPRNSISYLKNVVPVLWENGFLVTFGTEHNTPAMPLMVPEAKGEEEIPAELLQYNIDSVCILLAHQYLMEKENKGWPGESGQPRYEDQEYFIHTGQNLLHYIFSGY
ncbi:MAG: PHP domain-containing protein, partial [Bacteroidota bacterium]